MLRIVEAKKEDFKYAEEVSDELHDFFIYCLSQNERGHYGFFFFFFFHIKKKLFVIHFASV